jgi:(1->4)-alpha-D-glucan 1-alpha-D-glucosylmutase
MPTAADRLMLFQTIVGAWRMELMLSEPDNFEAFAVRLSAWQQKALREAKTFSDWSAPDEAYERAAQDFIQRLFGGSSDLLMQIAAFVQRVAPAGAANGLAQALLKLTAPGVPDIYQGTEYWDFSLVDPDNRTAVDFPAREASLASAISDRSGWSWTDRRAKQFVIARCLALRKKEPALFADATFLPLETQGPAAAHIVAYARAAETSAAVVTLCRLPAKLLTNNDFPRIAAERWSGTHIIIPVALRGMTVANVLSPGQVLTLDEKMPVGQILSPWPVGLFISSRS